LTGLSGSNKLVAMGCFACDAAIELASGQRVGFRDACAACGADLHSCRNCGHHDPSAYNECRESSAERVSDRERANRCDYFAPGTAVGGGIDTEEQAARTALDDLFRK
jgi:hypothetical protein